MSVDWFEVYRLVAGLVPRGLRRGQFAAPPLLGYLDRLCWQGDVVSASGWLIGRGAPIVDLSLVAAGQAVPVKMGLPRPDVASSFPTQRDAHDSGFALDVSLPADVADVEIWATLRGGRRVRAFRCAVAGRPGRSTGNGTARMPAVVTGPGVQTGARAPRSSPDRRRLAALVAGLRARVVVELGAPGRSTALADAVRSAGPGATYYPVAENLGGPAGDVQICPIGLPLGDACRYFADGTVDLIAVHDDLPPSWLAKLSRRGVIWLAGGAMVGGTGLRMLEGRGLRFVLAPEAPTRVVEGLVRDWDHLRFPGCDEPVVSIVIPVHGRLSLTVRCLESLLRAPTGVPCEVIVVDDDSPDETGTVLRLISGVRLVSQSLQSGYGESCNRGADAARGRYLVFLNNDTEVEPGWLDALLRVFEHEARAGLVGAKLVHFDGTLQEAGSLIFRDGSAMNWGRGDDPEHPRYNFLRDADYCSGACLMVPTVLFRRLGGFDRRYAPAYYEDVDLAFRVREAGWRVLYQPLARVRHHEGGTAGTDPRQGIKRYQPINQERFRQRWHGVLDTHPARPVDERTADPGPRGGKRLLVIDHTTPRIDQDAGSVRMDHLLRLFVKAGLRVTFAADDLQRVSPHTERLQQIGVEVLYASHMPSIRSHLEERGHRYDAVLLSRRDPSEKHMPAVCALAPRALRIFDTVDLHFLREQREACVLGDHEALARAEGRKETELALMRESHVTLVVSALEKDLLERDHGIQGVEVIGNIHKIATSVPPISARRDLVFVGYFVHRPNVDAVLWFVRESWPLVRRQLPDVRLHVIGRDPPAEVVALASDMIHVHGQVPQLEALLDSARVMVAPLRYGAGVKGKITQALSRGLPVVATPVGVEGMGLRDGEGALVADGPAEFATSVTRLYTDAALWERLSQGALAHAREHLSVEAVGRRVDSLLERAGLRGDNVGAVS